MTKYRVKFELYGKFLQTEIEARTHEEAKQKIRDKIKFHSIVEVYEPNPFQEGKDIFDILKGFGK